jgi:phytoene dehydrogenase-like protein
LTSLFSDYLEKEEIMKTIGCLCSLLRTLLVGTAAVVSLVWGMGCGGDDSGGDDVGDGGADVDSDSDTDTDTDTGSDTDDEIDGLTSATPGAGHLLDESHTGWSNPGGPSCHDGAHGNGFPVPACAHCHGTNGAPPRPSDHTDGDCGACHESQHSPLALTPPNDCRSCHAFESTDACAFTENYDVVVIGAGGGGLAAATHLAKNGQNVLLIEQHYKVGGCMVTFERGGYTFEASLHAFDGMGLGTLNDLGVLGDVEPVSSEIMYRSIFPDFTIDVPADVEQYRALLKERFPDEAAHIDELFDVMTAFDLSTYQDMSLSEMLDSIGIEDEKLTAVITQLSGFLAVGPENLPASLFIAMWAAYHTLGYYYFVGGSQSITSALAELFVENGGALKLHSSARKIVVEDGLATQVQTSDGGCYNTSHVISNANLPDTYLTMVGEENLPSDVVQDAKTKEPAPTISMIFLGVNWDYTDLFPSDTHEMWVQINYGEGFDDAAVEQCDMEEQGFVLANYTTLDPTNAEPGKNVIIISTGLGWNCGDEWKWNDSYEDYNAYKKQLADYFIERAEEYLPDLSAHIEVLEVGSPRAIQAYTLNPKGSWAGYGVDPEAGLSFMDAEAHKTPIPNLFLTGAWVVGAGQSVVLNSGITAANIVLDEMNRN